MTDRKSPIEQALDLFFYAPLGFFMNAQEIVPQLIEKGHQQVVTARMFGKFAVDQAPAQLAEVQKRVQKVADQISTGARPKRPAPAPTSTNGNAATQTSAPVSSATVTTPAAPAHGPAAAGLAIPDYDSLSASQVVPRLDGLSDDELAAVRDYEGAHRGRKTILNKIEQLQA